MMRSVRRAVVHCRELRSRENVCDASRTKQLVSKAAAWPPGDKWGAIRRDPNRRAVHMQVCISLAEVVELIIRYITQSLGCDILSRQHIVNDVG
ncbi:hypothetical protein BRAS3809_690003 [Bradyrhizobium sp. STM 3809]|nr:hypothetical protein BRAS3809_690003 [Bradyrhizobium sp. STM 3809]